MCTYITAAFMNSNLEKRSLKSRVYPEPQRFSLHPYSPPVPHPHDCLSATRFNSLLVLYKLRNGGLGYFLFVCFFFCNESERCKISVHTLKSYEQRHFLLLFPLVWLNICLYVFGKKCSWATVQYCFVLFSIMYSMGCSRSQAPMRLFLCKVLGRL